MAMSADSIPVIDLRLLTQSDINTLALSSPNAFNLDTLSDVVPKIDRSVFNESAGSRKQTYSRLPLVHQSNNPNPSPNPQLPQPPNPQPLQPQPQPTNPTIPRRRGRPRLHPIPTAAAPAAGPSAEEPDLGRQENLQIVSILKKLFQSRDNGGKPNGDITKSHSKTVENSNAVAVVGDAERDRDVHNGKGEAVDLAGLAAKEDLFGEEIRRRTDGLRTEEQLLGYMTGLDGQWGSRRKKRKVVDAAVFGDALPRGWKVLLGLKRKEGIVYINCRRYVSPSGKQFVSCKEVSSYILSLNGQQDATQPISGQHDNRVSRTADLTVGRVVGLTHQDGNTNELASCSFVSPMSHVFTESKKQKRLFSVKKQVVSQLDNSLECQECNMTFGDKDARLQHMSTFHQRSTKRRRRGKSLTDGVIVKDGKYECQFCHKTFTERHRYSGHIGAHIRYEGLGVDATPQDISTRASNEPSPLPIVPVLSEMNILADKIEEAYATKSINDNKHIGSPRCMLEADTNGVKHDPEASVRATTEAVSSDHKHEIEHIPKVAAPEIIEAASCNNRIEHDPREGASEAVSRDSKTEHYPKVGIPEITETVAIKSTIEHDPQEGIPEIADDVSKSEFVDRQSEDCNITCEKSIEVIEARNVTDMTFNAGMDVIYPCGIDVNNVSHTCSPITAQEPSTTSKHIHDHINGGEMSGDKASVIEDNVEDVEPNMCVEAIAPPLAVDDTPCETISDADLPFKSKIVNGNINEHIMPGYNLDNDANIGNAMSSEIAEEIDQFSLKDKFADEKINGYDVTGYKSTVVDSTDDMGIEDNACMDVLSPSLIDVDNTSYESHNAVDPASANYNGGRKISEEGHMLSLSGNYLSYGMETYSSNILESKAEEHVELDASIHVRSNAESCGALTSKDTGIASTMQSELHTSYIFANIANEPTSGIETNADCMFSGDLNKSLLDGIDRVGNEFQNYFHSSNGCNDDASGTIMNNVDGRQALQVNIDNQSSSWLQSSSTIPILDLIQDQCHEEFRHTDSRNEQANISDFGDLRLGSIEPADFVLFSGQPPGASGSVTRSPMELFPDDQLEWGMSLTKMVPTSVSTSVCVWCSREFSLEGVQSEPQSESLGYMCPDCKAKISGQLGLLNNGFS